MANEKIKQLLLKAIGDGGISRRQLALKMGVPPQSINNWIDSPTQPDDASRAKIAAYFHVRKADLEVDGEEVKPPPVATPSSPASDLASRALLRALEEQSKRIDALKDAVDSLGRHYETERQILFAARQDINQIKENLKTTAEKKDFKYLKPKPRRNAG